MSKSMNQKKLQALAEELAKDIKTPEDRNRSFLGVLPATQK